MQWQLPILTYPFPFSQDTDADQNNVQSPSSTAPTSSQEANEVTTLFYPCLIKISDIEYRYPRKDLAREVSFIDCLISDFSLQHMYKKKEKKVAFGAYFTKYYS